MAFFEKINLVYFNYTCLTGVETIFILVVVTSLGGYMTCAIGFPIYCFRKII